MFVVALRRKGCMQCEDWWECAGIHFFHLVFTSQAISQVIFSSCCCHLQWNDPVLLHQFKLVEMMASL